MSFCVKCGWEYAHKSGVYYCGHCGLDLRKAPSVRLASEAQDTPCTPQLTSSHDKPIAGIIVGMVFGVIGLLWTCAVLFQNLYGTPNNIQITLIQTFPSLQVKTNIGLLLGMLGNTVLIIGALMSHMRHPKGPQTIRVTAYSMMASAVLLSVISYFAVTGADAWEALDGQIKGTLIGGIVGGLIGALIQWGLGPVNTNA